MKGGRERWMPWGLSRGGKGAYGVFRTLYRGGVKRVTRNLLERPRRGGKRVASPLAKRKGEASVIS